MLLLGRLDGRLQSSIFADIFLARCRLDGAAQLACLAGVPIDVDDLQDWIAGRSPPPRASEGLNDPISVAALFHVAISNEEGTKDAILNSTRNVLRSVLDDRTLAESYGSDDLAYFGPLWRKVREAADAPLRAGSLLDVAHRVYDLAALTETDMASGADVVTQDGRSLTLAPRGRERNWLIATSVPRILYRAGFTSRIIPSLILLPKFLPNRPERLAVTMEAAIGRSAGAAHKELGRIEREAARSLTGLSVTRRSKAPLLARLLITYPGLEAGAVARLLEITPQGARKLLATLSRARTAR